MIIAIGGAVGAGKTTLAYKIQKYLITSSVMAEVVDNDIERRKYLGYSIDYLTTQKDYTQEINKEVMDICYQKAERYVKEGVVVVIPMGFWIKEYRDGIKDFAKQINSELKPIWLDVEISEVKRRIVKRLDEKASGVIQSEYMGHASDGNIEVLEKHVINVPDSYEGWAIVDANGDANMVFDNVIKIIADKRGKINNA